MVAQFLGQRRERLRGVGHFHLSPGLAGLYLGNVGPFAVGCQGLQTSRLTHFVDRCPEQKLLIGLAGMNFLQVKIQLQQTGHDGLKPLLGCFSGFRLQHTDCRLKSLGQSHGAREIENLQGAPDLLEMGKTRLKLGIVLRVLRKHLKRLASLQQGLGDLVSDPPQCHLIITSGHSILHQ